MIKDIKSECEYLRQQATERFNRVRPVWMECLRWALPHRAKWLESITPGARNNYHIIDPTHILALRSYSAGFLEGNTSASRPWYRIMAQDPDASEVEENHRWLDIYTERTLACFARSNFYNAAGTIYSDYGGIGTACHFIEEVASDLYFHVLEPGSYKIINDSRGNAIVLIREYSLSVKALVDKFGKKRKGVADWSNFTAGVRKMFEEGNYTQMIDLVTIVRRNDDFDVTADPIGANREWVTRTYEVGNARTANTIGSLDVGTLSGVDRDKFLEVTHSKRRPFIVARGEANGNFEYGEKCPTLDALGVIKSLNKKAIAKDQALEQMIKPALQGPANLKKSYITSQSNQYVPLDAAALQAKGLRPIFEINPAIGALAGDVQDMRQHVDKLYYADYLLYLSRNPKTRTATETNAIVQEQQLIIGPNLQSLNWTYNVPLVEFVMDFVLDNDPFLPPPPVGLQGQFLRTEFISVFAQAQKAADLPSIERYMQSMMNIAATPVGQKIGDKLNLDKYADLMADRLFLPAGLNNPQAKVDALRQQAQAAAEKQRALEQTLPAVAGAAKDLGMNQQQPQQQQPQQGLRAV